MLHLMSQIEEGRAILPHLQAGKPGGYGLALPSMTFSIGGDESFADLEEYLVPDTQEKYIGSPGAR
jgi:hypothetical protein